MNWWQFLVGAGIGLLVGGTIGCVALLIYVAKGFRW